jgi:hypothetical protein
MQRRVWRLKTQALSDGDTDCTDRSSASDTKSDMEATFAYHCPKCLHDHLDRIGERERLIARQILDSPAVELWGRRKHMQVNERRRIRHR